MMVLGVDGLAQMNAEDPSLLLAPGGSWSTTSTVSTRARFYLGVGNSAPSPPFALGSEYGSVRALEYLSLSLFF